MDMSLRAQSVLLRIVLLYHGPEGIHRQAAVSHIFSNIQYSLRNSLFQFIMKLQDWACLGGPTHSTS